MTENENETKKPDFITTIESAKLTLPLVLFIIALSAMVLWAIFPGDVTLAIFSLIILCVGGLFGVQAVKDFWGFDRDAWKALPLLTALVLLGVLLTGSGMLLSILFSSYFLVSILFSGKVIKLQTAIIIVIAITAIMFRVYPAMDCGNPSQCPMPGHLASMDDPYYHYKQTERLYTLEDVPDSDFSIYPPEGRPAPEKFSYYYNVYMAHLTGGTIRDVTILYPVFISALGAILMFFLLRELTGDWKSGFIGGFLFATMPALLDKSAAGAIEEDMMGLVMGIFAMYLLIKAINSHGKKNLKFAVLSGFAFFITLISWKGVIFLYAIPFSALALYAAITILFAILMYLKRIKSFDYPIWEIIRAGFIAGIIPILGNSLFLNFGDLSLEQLAPFGAMVVLGVLSEFIRMRVVPDFKDTKFNLEKKYFKGFAILVLVVAVIVVLLLGVDKIADLPQKTFDVFAGTTSQKFLVDKTIQEQAALSKGDLIKKLDAGYDRYWISELLTLVMIPMMFVLLVYYFFTDRDKMFVLLRAYLVGLVFFLIAMNFVWLEARLAFSQSLGFLMLGAMVGLLLPKNLKEVQGIKIIPFLIIVVLIPVTIFYHGIFFEVGGSAWDNQRPAGVSPAWFMGVKWLDENIQTGEYVNGEYVNGDFVLTWWDYGHFITALSGSTVIADPLQAKEDYIMETARFFYNKTTEDEAMKWIMEQPWNTRENGEYKVKYMILDSTLISKASALAFLGTNYYQIPNGQNAVNGVCSVGEVCQNVEIKVNGETLIAEQKDDKYVCSEGVVCTGDTVARFETRRCCEEAPTACCNQSFDWREVDENDGSPALFRSTRDPVYGQYQLTKGKIVCGRPEYTTSTDPFFLVVDGQRKTVVKSYMYSGNSALPYGDGNYYHAFVQYLYADGKQDTILISGNCEAKDANEVLALNKDLLVPLLDGVKIGEDIRSYTYVHVAEKWMDNMFTQIYLLDGRNLNNIEPIRNSETNQFYPIVKIFKVSYPDEIPDISSNNNFSSLISEPEVEFEIADDGSAKAGDDVEVDYIGTFENGTIFDTSIGRSPLSFTLGTGRVIPGFDAAVTGMKVGESKTVTIPPEQAYGVDGTHALAGKTLIFEISLLTINGEGATEEIIDEPAEEVNLTFDHYSPELAESYNIEEVPYVVWNCQYFKKGLFVGDFSELDVLKTITCAVSEGKPENICLDLGILLNEATGKIQATLEANNALADLKRVKDSTSCGEQNSTKISVFYDAGCTDCVTQKKDLEQLAVEFGDLIEISYHCVGDESYCTKNLETTQ